MSRRLDLASLVALLLGFGIATYLTIVHYQDDLLVCGVGGDCHAVQSSDYATLGPIPVALLGAGAMAGLIALWLLRWWRPEHAELTTGLSFAVLLMAVATEAWLTWVELAVLDAICQWCVAFAVVLVVLLALETVRLWRVVLAGPDGMA